MRWRVEIPRRFLMTNELLKLHRKAGFYEGVHAGSRTLAPKAKGYDAHAAEVRDVRNVVALHFRKYAGRRPTPVAIVVYFHGHEKHDPDAGCLTVKAIVDGMKDSGFLRSDLDDVLCAFGVVVHPWMKKWELLDVDEARIPSPGFVGVAIEVGEVKPCEP